MKIKYLACVTLLLLFAGDPAVAADLLPIELIRLPKGFSISVYADQIENARSMALSPGGVVYVGTRTAGKVYAVVDDNKDMKADRVITLAEGLNMPNGVALRDGSLYVAEVHRVIKFEDMDKHLTVRAPRPVVVSDAFPDNRSHGWKFIRFGPDGKLYVPVGAPCNVCDRPGTLYGTITRMDPDGKNLEVFAEGVRNSVGFDWDPVSGDLWFTDNGRDLLGDDLPPDELNHAPRRGMHFGFPYCHGRDILDPKFGDGHTCEAYEPATQVLGPHVAALGMRFYNGGMFPEKYRGQILIAEHGSWNRSKKIGYRIMLVTLKQGQPASYEVFAEGWKQGERAWGRPVDIEILPDGSILVSDDFGNAIYRIAYNPSEK